MPCTYCNTQFTLLNWKLRCGNCARQYCVNCISAKLCKPCTVVIKNKHSRALLMDLKVRDLKIYLQNFKIEHRACKEKAELVILIQNQFGISQPQVNTLHNYATGESPRPNQDNQRNPIQESRTENAPSTNATQMEENSASGTPFNARDRTGGVDPEVGDLPTPPSYQRTQEAFASASEFNPNVPGASNTNSEQNPTGTQSNTNLHEENGVNVGESNPESASGVVNSQQSASETTYSYSSSRAERTDNKTIIGLSEVKSASEIDSYSVKQLKTLLKDNFVSYKGVFERKELVNRVKNLYEDNLRNAANVEDQSETGSSFYETHVENFCKVCWENPVDCVFIECGHLVTCVVCGKQLRQCPICNERILRTLRVFKS